MKKQVKKAVPSSEGLRDCLQSIEDRFPWSPIKYWFVTIMSFIIQVIIGPGFYGLDVYTDVRFTLDMFNQAQRNFTEDVDSCKPDFSTNIHRVMNVCEANLTEEVCNTYLCRYFFTFHLSPCSKIIFLLFQDTDLVSIS